MQLNNMLRKILESKEGILAVLGGVLLNLISGNISNWGSIYPYVGSFLASKQKGLTYSKVYNAQPFSFLFENLGVFLGPLLVRNWGLKSCLLLGGALMSGAFILSSSAESAEFLVGVYSSMFGVGAGLVTINTLLPGWKHFPNSKGFVTGCIMTGYSGSSILFTVLFAQMVNPRNLPPDPDLRFPKEVEERVPWALFQVGILFACLTVLGVILLSTPAEPREKPGSTRKVTLTTFLSCPQFWQLFCTGYCMFIFWYYFAGVYKSFGLEFIQDDHFLSYLGSAANLVGAVGRWFWPTLIDYFSFKKVMSAAVGYQLLVCTCVYFVADNKEAYSVAVVTVYFATAAMYPGLAVQTGKMFKDYTSRVWPLVFLGVTLASASSILLNAVASSAGFLVCFWVQSFVLVLGLFFIWRLAEHSVLKQIMQNEEALEPLIRT